MNSHTNRDTHTCTYVRTHAFAEIYIFAARGNKIGIQNVKCTEKKLVLQVFLETV